MSNLNPQQFQPHEVDVLRAGDFPGSIGDKAARTRFDRYNKAETMRSSHREAGGPLPYLDQFINTVKESGKIEEPVEVTTHEEGDYYKIHDGHHRAFAAHALGLPLPYKVVD